ncbi:hypothetical protein [Thermosynechococcus vestitus]|uniref:Tll1835 protein n=1 Tax=Thermosynechococcus vestitus (strain NIES-2133 / IAM M-273 / BP-1) TaxID=197221 RepID=Q8DHV8_THEVB|nr:hypothetical protein [Thermosynechococcus vestitus]BAC09387.1 tll1835 [Thermosynechococcus vestitus BP-1]BAY53156.1 hypothetical protein NIES2134_117600 [Thermostichus vulcanus NIES-2134]
MADFQEQLQRLQEQLQRLQAQANQLPPLIPEPPPPVDPDNPDWADERARIEARVRRETSVPELQAQLIAALLENEQLRQALEEERQNHARTREGLITALGDALDTLKRRRRSPKPP